MQTDDNLISLVGKPSAKKWKKNHTRNREAYMLIENLLQQQAHNIKSSTGTEPASQGILLGGESSSTSQAPKPSTPGAASKQTPGTKSQPVIAGAGMFQPQTPAATIINSNTPAPAIRKRRQEPTWLTTEKLMQWKQFQENIHWNFDAAPKNQDLDKPKVSFSVNGKGKHNSKPINTKPQAATSTENKATKAEPKMAEIKWELNQVDDLDDSTEDSPAKSQTKQVVQGYASEIKLTVRDQRKLVITPTDSSQSNTGSKPVEVKHQKLPGGNVYEYNYKAENRQNLDRKELPDFLSTRHMPAGVPRTFLMQQTTFGAIQPQQNPTVYLPVNAPASHQQPQPAIQIPVQLNYTTTNNSNMGEKQQYSPTEMYDPVGVDNEDAEGRDSPDAADATAAAGGHKRLSAFHRLGPVSEPKKPKLTINLLCNKDVREVVDDTKKEVQHTPVHLRQDILQSSDDIVTKYLPWWPWKKNVPIKKSVSARSSKTVMILEQEQMEEAYEKDNVFFQVYVRDFPPHWNKEQVLDLVLENVRGKSFIPCFIEFTPKYCKFLVIRSKSALTAIHKLGFYMRHEDSEIGITIMYTDITLNQIDFIPRLVLRKILSKRYDSEMKLDLEAFTLQEDVSHFIYFPLSRLTNQSELTQMQSTVAWEYLTDLNLSHNRLESVDGFDLESRCPRLRRLDVSHNRLRRATGLLRSRTLPLKALKLEGNPLCRDYTDPERYVMVVKMMFPGLTELDGLPIQLKGDPPKIRRHYCPEAARALAEQFLEVFFPLLDSEEERNHIQDLYAENAVMTITYRYSARSYLYRHFRNLIMRARCLEEGEMDAVEGATSIAKLISKWPPVEHDPATFTSDVLYHTELSTILRVGGILKLTSDSLAEDEHLLAFSRTFVLTSRNGVEYKIQNEMVHFDEPTSQFADMAFQINSVRQKRLSLKFESPPDKETKDGLIDIFSQITESDKETSERCLEVKEWNMKNALEHFMKLVKLDNLDSLKKSDPHRES